MARTGRPSEYSPDLVVKVEELCRSGSTIPQVAEYIGVDVTTVYRWRHQHRDFRHALKIGRAAADNAVERALYSKAVGHQQPAVKIHVGKDGEVTQVPYIERFAPDTTAAIFWLKNRRPDEWRENNAQASQLQLTLSGPLAERLVGHLTQGMNQPQVIDAVSVTRSEDAE